MGAFKYYVIALGGGGVGGPALIADADDGGVGVRNQNDDVILEYVSY